MSNLYNYRNAIYSLKLRQGIKVTLHHVSETDFDPDTGEQTNTKVSNVVYRAVVGTEEIMRVFGQQLGANYGGDLDKNKRIILIDKFDLPLDHVFTRNDQIEIGSEQWRIVKIQLISNIAYYVEAEQANE